MNPGIERLLTVGEKANLGKLERIPELAMIDAECAVFKIRQLTERLCRRIVQPKEERAELESMITAIDKQKLLGSGKAVVYLRTIQGLGNRATHNTDDLFLEEFNLDDVNHAAETLAKVLDAAWKHGRLGGS
jgi:hypothetical protein